MDKRQFLKHSALALSLLPLTACAVPAGAATARPQATNRILPKPLRRGDTVGLIASSAAVADLEDLVTRIFTRDPATKGA